MTFSFQLMHCLACFMSSMLLLYFIPCAVRHSTGFVLVLHFFPFFGDRSVLIGHVYSALSEEMPTGAGRAVTNLVGALRDMLKIERKKLQSRGSFVIVFSRYTQQIPGSK